MVPELNEPSIQQYFDRLIKTELADAPIVCRHAGSHKGKAIYATQTHQLGNLIWSEKPFVAMQHDDNKEEIDSCAHCFITLADSRECWRKIAAGAKSTVESPATMDEFTHAIASLQQLGGKSDEETYYNVYRIAQSKVTCVCGTLYCSETCLQAAYHAHHALLCPRSSDYTQSAMGHFLNHTLGMSTLSYDWQWKSIRLMEDNDTMIYAVTNEIFQLAATVIAKVIVRFLSTHDINYAKEPVDRFCKQPWWDVVTSEEDLEPNQSMEEYKEVFKGLVNQTLGHFLQGLNENISYLVTQDDPILNGLSLESILQSCQEILTLEFFGSIVGMFEMNNISMEIRHPFLTLGEALHQAIEEKGEEELPAVVLVVNETYEAFQQNLASEEEKHDHCGCGTMHHHEEEDDTCGDNVFVSVEGTALFSGICTMNHSCDPNVTVIYMKDGTAQVYAVKDIQPGDELCIAYIDVDGDVEERQELLREYQFVCDCTRCEQERHA